MENKNDSKTIKLQYEIADDKLNVTLHINNHDNEISLKALDTISIQTLIATLGEVRGQMLEPIPDNLGEGIHPLAAYNPRWIISPDTTNKFATFWIRHPGLGWSGFGFPRHEAAHISKWLRKVVSFVNTRDTQSPAATSFGGDNFLLSTEGLGFYYYGKGEKRIGPNPFEQVEFDSDRAAGIVAGSIAEIRLQQAIYSRLRKDRPKIAEELFRPSGALGSFGTKINIAYLMGILSDEAYKDLINLKNIRNDFAHNLEFDSFEVRSISDRCKNFRLINRHIGPIPNISLNNPPRFKTEKANPYFGLPDYEEKLSDPRFLYTMTAQLISFLLGEGSENENAILPLV